MGAPPAAADPAAPDSAGALEAPVPVVAPAPEVPAGADALDEHPTSNIGITIADAIFRIFKPTFVSS